MCGEGGKNLQNQNVRQTLVVNGPLYEITDVHGERDSEEKHVEWLLIPAQIDFNAKYLIDMTSKFP